MTTTHQTDQDPGPTVAFKRLAHGTGLALPAYQTSGAAGVDLSAAIGAGNPVILLPRARMLVPTGFAVAVPRGYEMQVRPRSGLAAKHGVTVLNTPGTIDSDYRGEVMVVLINLSDVQFEIARGDRIAQAVIAPVVHADILEVDNLDETLRGTGGFGSTGQ